LLSSIASANTASVVLRFQSSQPLRRAVGHSSRKTWIHFGHGSRYGGERGSSRSGSVSSGYWRFESFPSAGI